MFQFLRKYIKNNLLLRSIVGHYIASSGLFDWYFIHFKLKSNWQKRAQKVIMNSDNMYIPRVEKAGNIISGKQIMHNGIKINLGSYYGVELAKLIYLNKGVHEPQEERAFKEVLKYIMPTGTMIEMGAFWSFYSMWFNKEVPESKNFMIEPDKFNIQSGIRNFKLNKMKGEFLNAYIGDSSLIQNGKIARVCVDDFIEMKRIDSVDILHSDIQGYELDMLKGAQKTFQMNKISYAFISTHSETLHYSCIEKLKEYEYRILCEADLNQSCSEDGLIVACSKKIETPVLLNITKEIKC